MPVAMSRSLRSRMSPTSGANQRAVPRMRTVSGMTLKVSPPWMLPIVMTPACAGSTLRATMLWRAVTMWAAITTGSLPWCGMAPCAPLPVMAISRLATAAMIGPSRHRNVAGRGAGPVVQAVDALDGEAVEQPFFHHDAAAAAILLGGLEDEVDGAAEVARFGQILGGAEQHGGVAVMAAGVHPAGVREA